MGIAPNWVFGFLVAFGGLIGLFVASRAHDGFTYLFGLLIFAFAVLFIFGLIARHVGHKAAAPPDPHDNA